MATYEEEYARGAEKASAKRGYEEGYKEAYGGDSGGFNWQGFAEGVAGQGFKWLDRELANDAAVRRQESLNKVEMDFRSRSADSGYRTSAGAVVSNDQLSQMNGNTGSLTTAFNQMQTQNKAAQTAETQAEIEKYNALSGMRSSQQEEKLQGAKDLAIAQAEVGADPRVLAAKKTSALAGAEVTAEIQEDLSEVEVAKKLRDPSTYKTKGMSLKDAMATVAKKQEITGEEMSPEQVDAAVKDLTSVKEKMAPVEVLNKALTDPKILQALGPVSKSRVNAMMDKVAGGPKPVAKTTNALVGADVDAKVERVTTEADVEEADLAVDKAQKAYNSLEEKAIMISNKRMANIPLTKKEKKIQSDFDKVAEELRGFKIEAIKTKAARAHRGSSAETLTSPEQQRLREEIERTAMSGGKTQGLLAV